MGVNKEDLGKKYIEAVVLKSQGKSFDEIAKIMGTTKNTAWRWYYKGIEQDGTIMDVIEELKFSCLEIAIEGKGQLKRYVKQIKDSKLVSTDEAKAVEKISENNMKGYSSLQGANTDKNGGEMPLETKTAMNKLLDRIL